MRRLAWSLLLLSCAVHGPTGDAPAPTPASAPAPAPVAAAPDPAPAPAVTCDPQVPAWELALAEGYAWDMLHPGDYDGMSAARERASQAIDALPADDPRLVEAHCRAGFAQHNRMNVGRADRHFRSAIAALRSRGIADPELRYKTAGQPAFTIALEFDLSANARRHVQMRTTTGMSLDSDDCRTPDIALLELARARLYHSANRQQLREVIDRPRGKLGSMSADVGAALQREIVAALGPAHRLAIAMREHMAWLCDERQTRAFPKQCPPLSEVRKRNLAELSAAFSDQDPDARRNALFLGADQLAAGLVPEARRLFKQAIGGTPDDITIAALQLLAGLELDDGRAPDGLGLLMQVAVILPVAASDRYWDTLQAWRLHEGVARLANLPEEIERARREQARVEADYHYVGPGGPSVAMIAAALAAGDGALLATAVSGVITARTHELKLPDRSAEARAWRTAELDVALQCRALLRRRASDDAGADDDLRALAALRAASAP